MRTCILLPVVVMGYRHKPVHRRADLRCFNATRPPSLHPRARREDVFAFVMTTTETYALAKFAPSIARNATLASGCALSLPRRRTAPVPAYMCDATQVGEANESGVGS